MLLQNAVAVADTTDRPVIESVRIIKNDFNIANIESWLFVITIKNNNNLSGMVAYFIAVFITTYIL
ncbi:hypothetical protein KUC3_02620 [Alteromonas sp. KC3]|jgi:hypothetical protein|nr:hypothetical protein KUC3_02620 [Alteromonas sp. KC3]BCO21395.1 hypothetical protein KUC14_02640 [Alteromonas sp. KC14]